MRFDVTARMALTAMAIGAGAPAAWAGSVGGCMPGNAGVTCLNAGGDPVGELFTDMFAHRNATVDPGVGWSFTPAGLNAMVALANNESGLFAPPQCQPRYPVDVAVSEVPAALSQSVSVPVCGAPAQLLPGLSAFIGAGRPLPSGGQFAQIPMAVYPLAIPLKNSRVGRNGAVSFTYADLCGIFSGKITRWEQTSAAAKLSPGVISVMYHQGKAAATLALTRFLASVCRAGPGGNSLLTFSATLDFLSLFPGGAVPIFFSGRIGNQGVADAVNTTAGSIGYGPSQYTSIAPVPAAPSPGSPPYTGLFVASVTNAISGKSFLPNQAGVKGAVLKPGAGATNTRPPTTAAAAAIQSNWVPTDPSAVDGYPIWNVVTWDVASCYAGGTASTGRGTKIRDFLRDYFRSPSDPLYDPAYNMILTNAGLYPMSTFGTTANWPAAILGTFVTNTAPRNFNLSISGAQCAGVLPR